MNDFEVVHLADTHISNMHLSNMFCQLLSCWLLGAATSDRYITIIHTIRASNMCNSTIALIAISLIVILFGSIIAIGYLFESGVPYVALFALIYFIIYKMCNLSVIHESTESEQEKTAVGQRYALIILILNITTFSLLMLTPFPTVTFISKNVDGNFILGYSNYAVKMFLYSLLDKTFREKMMNLLCTAFKTCIMCCKIKKAPYRVFTRISHSV